MTQVKNLLKQGALVTGALLVATQLWARTKKTKRTRRERQQTAGPGQENKHDEEAAEQQQRASDKKEERRKKEDDDDDKEAGGGGGGGGRHTQSTHEFITHESISDDSPFLSVFVWILLSSSFLPSFFSSLSLLLPPPP